MIFDFRPLFVLLIGIAALFGTYFYGKHIAHNDCIAAANKEKVAAQARYDALAIDYNKVSAQLEAKLNEHAAAAQEVVRTVTKIIDRPIYHNECFDAVGVSVANDALTGKSSGSSQPDK